MTGPETRRCRPDCGCFGIPSGYGGRQPWQSNCLQSLRHRLKCPYQRFHRSESTLTSAMVYYLAERTPPHKSGRRVVTSIKIERESDENRHRCYIVSTHAFVQDEEIKGFFVEELRFYTCSTANLHLIWSNNQWGLTNVHVICWLEYMAIFMLRPSCDIISVTNDSFVTSDIFNGTILMDLALPVEVLTKCSWRHMIRTDPTSAPLSPSARIMEILTLFTSPPLRPPFQSTGLAPP